MKWVDILERFIFNTSKNKFFLFFIVAITIKVGFWCMPNYGSSQVIAQNPFVNPFIDQPEAHYMMWSWLSPFLCWVFHLTNVKLFLGFHFLCFIAFLGGFIAFVWAEFPEETARKAVCLFFVLPVSETSLFWIGMDSCTLLCMLLGCIACYKNRKIIAFVTGILLGIQHFEQGIVGTLVLFCVLLMEQWQCKQSQLSAKNVFFWVLGVLVGKLILMGIFYQANIITESNRISLAHQHQARLITLFFLHMQAIIWSVLGVAWFVVLKYFEKGKSAIPLVVAILATIFVVGPLVGDQTRVLVNILFPLLCFQWLFNQAFLNTFSKQAVAVGVGFWLVIPWIWVWGNVKGGIFFHDIAVFSHVWFGWFNQVIPHQSLNIWPFG